MKNPPTFQEIIALAAEDAASDNLNQFADLPGRFPVTVEAETRAFLEAQSQRLKISLASVAGLILDHVARESLKRSTS